MISGRRGAPGRSGLHPLLNVQLAAVGNYELSGTPEKPGPAEQTLIGVVQVSAPAGPYTVWAERAGSSKFEQQSPRDRLLYVLNDQQIVASERLIGEPPAYLAVLADRPSDSGTVSKAFADTRYDWKKTEALYSQADQNRIPRMVFLHWAELRPTTDWSGRSARESAPAQRLSGTMVFPIQVPVSPGDREPPQATFDEAFGIQFPGGGALLPSPTVTSSSQAVDEAKRAAAQSSLLVLGIVGLAAIAAWAGNKAVKQMRGAHA